MKEEKHTHQFVNQYQGLIGFGLDRETDEKSLMVYLQKFSDDSLLNRIIPRLSDQEIQDLFNLISRLLKTHLKEEEYHRLFLKESEDEHSPGDPQPKVILPFPEKQPLSSEDQLRWLCSKQGLTWDQMSEEERETFINDLSHA
jgi:hypothetical protein